MTDQTTPEQPLATLPDAHRVVIVDDVDGRVFDESSRYEHGARILVQDHGRTVKILPAPPKSLAEQMLDIAGGISSDFGAYADDLNTLADRVEAVVKELAGTKRDYIECQEELLVSEEKLKDTRLERDEARAEVEASMKANQELVEHHVNTVVELDEALAEVERLKATVASRANVAADLPDPASIPATQPWLVRDGQGLCLGLRCEPKRLASWYLLRVRNAAPRWRIDDDVTLVRPIDLTGLNPNEVA